MSDWDENFLKENDLYLTRQQVERIINYQSKFTAKVCANYFKYKDLNHIGLVYTLEHVLIDYPDDISDLYNKHLEYLNKKYREKHKEDGFKNSYTCQFTEEEKAKTRRLLKMTDKETEEYLKDIKWSDTTYEDMIELVKNGKAIL